MHKKKKPTRIKKQLNRIEQKEDAEIKKLDKLTHEVEELENTLKHKKKKALRKIDFKQTGGCKMPTNFSIDVGSTGSFSAVLTPPGGAQAPNTVPQWTASDPSIVLTPSADGLTCQAAVPTGFAAASFDLKLLAVSSDPNVGNVTASHTITVNQPAPAPLTAIDFVQTA